MERDSFAGQPWDYKWKHLFIQSVASERSALTPLKKKKSFSTGDSAVKNLPAMQEMWVWPLGWEDSLAKEMATDSSILAWEIPWKDEPGGLQESDMT